MSKPKIPQVFDFVTFVSCREGLPLRDQMLSGTKSRTHNAFAGEV